MKKLIPALFALGAVLFAGAFFVRGEPASAASPCVVRSITAEEQQLLGMIQAWRGSAGLSTQFSTSATLNATAVGYAGVMAQFNSPSHNADGLQGMAWLTRAIQCGYPANIAAGGEGVSIKSTPAEALAEMVTHQGSGIYFPLPACVGVGKATVNGRTGWVVLLFQNLGSCPQAVTGAVQPSPTVVTPLATTPAVATATPTRTVTPLATITPSVTPTASPTPTPQVFRAFVPYATRD